MAIDLTQCSSDEGSASSSEAQLHEKADSRTYPNPIESEMLCSSDASASDTPLENETVRPSRRFEHIFLAPNFFPCFQLLSFIDADGMKRSKLVLTRPARPRNVEKRESTNIKWRATRKSVEGLSIRYVVAITVCFLLRHKSMDNQCICLREANSNEYRRQFVL